VTKILCKFIFVIFSDVATALNFLNNGHFYWGVYTVVPIFAPFAFRFSVAMMEFGKAYFR
jgi:hypothetical protein